MPPSWTLADPLARFRGQFVITDPDLIYLDGNSLGRLTHGVQDRIEEVVQREWGDRLVRAWNEGWWEAPSRIGDGLAPLLGASPGQVIISDQTSLNLFKLSVSALRLRPDRQKIITDTLNFPSDLYILQGVVELLGRGHEIIRIDSTDGGITPDLGALVDAIDEKTALVTLSHVAFKSGYLYDMHAITERAHAVGALVLWDLSHSAGAVPVHLDEWDVDLAIGCTYKYLNGGPGAPAFLYVNRRLQTEAESPIWGWWGDAQPFQFDLDYHPAAGLRRFLTGTAPMLSMMALEPALAPVIEAGVDAIRQKSILLTEYAVALIDSELVAARIRTGLAARPAAARRSRQSAAPRGLSHQSCPDRRHEGDSRFPRTRQHPAGLRPPVCFLPGCLGRHGAPATRRGRGSIREVPNSENARYVEPRALGDGRKTRREAGMSASRSSPTCGSRRRPGPPPA